MENLIGVDNIILVDKYDNEIGQMEKLLAHKNGLLHRAISVLITNSKGEWLLQKRASTKYHSPSLWTNTCCTHPAPGEGTEDAANRRLMEEMGMKAKINYALNFKYFVEFSNGLKENELDHLFIGVSDDVPVLNLEEVDDYKYMEKTKLFEDIEKNPDNYTEWFKLLIPQISGQI